MVNWVPPSTLNSLNSSCSIIRNLPKVWQLRSEEQVEDVALVEGDVGGLDLGPLEVRGGHIREGFFREGLLREGLFREGLFWEDLFREAGIGAFFWTGIRDLEKKIVGIRDFKYYAVNWEIVIFSTDGYNSKSEKNK